MFNFFNFNNRLRAFQHAKFLAFQSTMTRPENRHFLEEWNAAQKNAKKSINPLDITKEDFDIFCKGLLNFNIKLFKITLN